MFNELKEDDPSTFAPMTGRYTDISRSLKISCLFFESEYFNFIVNFNAYILLQYP